MTELQDYGLLLDLMVSSLDFRRCSLVSLQPGVYLSVADIWEMPGKFAAFEVCWL